MDTTDMDTANVERDRGRSPSWWTDDHDSTWERIRSALKADWEQTKRDFSKSHGRELDQSVGDTVKQMAGKEQPPIIADWDDVEPGVRYGYGSSRYYRDEDDAWNDELETRLREEWGGLDSGRDWNEVRPHVRRGWEFGRRKII
jgi:hypothetical protein